MSAGVFLLARYTASYDPTAIHPIRIQPETESLVVGAATNDRPAGATTNPISATVSRNKRQSGLIPRTITIKLNTTAPDPLIPTYKPGGIVRLPALNQAVWNAATKGTECTYLGSDNWIVVGRDVERAQ